MFVPTPITVYQLFILDTSAVADFLLLSSFDNLCVIKNGERRLSERASGLQSLAIMLRAGRDPIGDCFGDHA